MADTDGEAAAVVVGRRRRLVLAAVSLATVVVLAVPAVTGADGFPVSTQPMYAASRPAESTFVTAVGVDADGEEVRLGIGTIADTDDPLVARRRMRNAALGGDLDTTCRAIADRVGDERVVAVEIIEVRHDVIAFADGDEEPLARTELARCMVAR